MKLVLKYNDDIKLFSKPIDYASIVAFVVEEYSIDPATLELSFLDEDNDNITILSNEDVEVMQAVFEGKEYVKINVQGLIKEVQEVVVDVQEAKTEVKVQEIEEKVEEKVKEKVIEIVVIEDGKEVKVINKSEKPMIVEGVKEVEESKDDWKGHCHARNEKMQAFLKETVANLVDQRIKALLPCLKEQILNQQKNKPEPVGLIHEGFQCKGCLMNPIVGVRYQCPECPQFNLCQTCEAQIDHDHNLLKIKKLVEKKKEKKGWSGGKRFNFNESDVQEKRCPFKREKQAEVKPEKVEQIKKEEPIKVQEEVVIVKKDSAEVTQQKGAIFMQMKEIFGDQYTSEYFKFIEAHFSEGPEAIIQGWIDNASKLKK